MKPIRQSHKGAKGANIALDDDEETADLLDELQPLNIEARYPKDKETLLSSLTPQYCAELIARTERLIKWIRAKL